MMAFVGSSDLAQMDLNQGNDGLESLDLMDEVFDEASRRSPRSAKKNILAKYGSDEQGQQFGIEVIEPQSIQFSERHNWMERHQPMPVGQVQVPMNGLQAFKGNQGDGSNPFRTFQQPGNGVAANPYAVNGFVQPRTYANVASYNAMRNRQMVSERNRMNWETNQNQNENQYSRRQSGPLPQDVLGTINPFR